MELYSNSEYSSGRLFKRCVQCPSVAPRCPDCRSDEVCTTTIGDCKSCASATCVKTTLSGSTNANNTPAERGPNVAGIAGGVAGGIVGIAIVVFVIWKFWLKGKRREITPEELEYDDDLPVEKGTPNTGVMQIRDARSSTHTVTSMASTVLTRASNIIQIAYIPGVTNRGDDSIPPVPPIPIPTTPSTTGTYEGEQHFFVPHLRNSAYSDASSMMTADHRKSIASSLARSSIGTMIYQDNAIANPMPTTVARGGAKVVSVRSGGGSGNSTPASTPGLAPAEFARTASTASAGPRPVIVKMLGSSDSLKPGITTAKSMKPISLNIINKRAAAATAGPSSSADAGNADALNSPTTSSPAAIARRPNSRFPPSRPFTAYSVADSISTTRSSVMPHSRARASVARSHRTIGESDDEDDDDLDGYGRHSRSHKSLISRSPFGDDAAVGSAERLSTATSATGGGVIASPIMEEGRPGGKSPFDDRNAL